MTKMHGRSEYIDSMSSPLFQKQPPEMFYEKSCSQKQENRKTPVLESLFNKVAGLRHRCFPVNFVNILKTPFLQNTSGRLLLVVICFAHLVFLKLLIVLEESLESLNKSCSIKFCKFHRKRPVMESFFMKIAGFLLVFPDEFCKILN